MNEDGFVMEDKDEVNIFANIDTQCRVVRGWDLSLCFVEITCNLSPMMVLNI